VAKPSWREDEGAIFRLMEAARRHYDVVLVDTPPLNAVADALPYAVDADSMSFCRAGTATSAADMDTALDMLRRSRHEPCGVVVTQDQASRPAPKPHSRGYFRRA
jgi:succinoglycan biosynthesis transport protein ExoP